MGRRLGVGGAPWDSDKQQSSRRENGRSCRASCVSCTDLRGATSADTARRYRSQWLRKLIDLISTDHHALLTEESQPSLCPGNESYLTRRPHGIDTVVLAVDRRNVPAILPSPEYALIKAAEDYVATALASLRER